MKSKLDLFNKIFRFIISNFGPLIGFYLINLFWGFKIAIIVSILIVLFEYFRFKLRKQKIHRLFYFTSFIVITFGVADLIIQEPYFYEYEASLTNFIFSLIFAFSLSKNKSIVQEFAEMQDRTTLDNNSDKQYFFRFYTIIWSCYFLTKSIIYLYLSIIKTFDEALILRIFIGKISFWLMMFISIGLPNKIWSLFERYQLFPSQKKSSKGVIMKTNGIAAVMIHVPDWKIGLQWYRHAFPEAKTITLSEFNFECLEINGIRIEVVSADDKVGTGTQGIAVDWKVENFETALKHLTDLGATLYRGPMQIENGIRICKLKDPFGNLLGLRGP